jgi:hypothetical protein
MTKNAREIEAGDEHRRRRILMGASRKRNLWVVFVGDNNYLVRRVKSDGGGELARGNFCECIEAIDRTPVPASEGDFSPAHAGRPVFGAS